MVDLPPSRRHSCKAQLEIDLETARLHVESLIECTVTRSAHSIDSSYARSALRNYQMWALPLTGAGQNAGGRNIHCAPRFVTIWSTACAGFRNCRLSTPVRSVLS